MRLIERIDAFRLAHNVASGPDGPQYVASGHSDRPKPSNFYRHRNWVITEQAKLASGATITAVALGIRHAPSFDPLQVQMPVFFAHAPQGLAEPQSVVVKALLRQHLAHTAVVYAELLGALILLGHGQPRRAWHMIVCEDGQTNAHKAMALDLFVGVPLYAGVVACRLSVALGKRAVGAEAG